MRTKKVKVSLQEREAFVVAPVEFWEHLIEVYKSLAHEAPTNEDEQYWLEAIDFVRISVEDTLFDPDEESTQEEW